MKSDSYQIVEACLESAFAGEQALSFKDPLAKGLNKSIAQLTRPEIFEIGRLAITCLLDRQMASAHCERALRIANTKQA